MSLRAWLPRPWLSAGLLVLWLLLNNSLAAGQLVIGGLLAVMVAWPVARVWPRPVRLRRPGLLPRYLGRLLWDILIANLEVAWLILTRPSATLRARFIELPLDIQDEIAIAVLATTITLTPGTLAVEVMPDQHRLLIHCLDVADEAELVTKLKNRYEMLLKEMFAEC
jgi:multicomponent K+:H+ antiporter subunit E